LTARPWELGHKDADDYVKIAREAAKAMRSVDHNIRFVTSGSSNYESTGQWVEWNRKVLTGLGDMIDYLSIHRYWENSPNYYEFMGGSAMDFEEKITTTAAENWKSRQDNERLPDNQFMYQLTNGGRSEGISCPVSADRGVPQLVHTSC